MPASTDLDFDFFHFDNINAVPTSQPDDFDWEALPAALAAPTPQPPQAAPAFSAHGILNLEPLYWDGMEGTSQPTRDGHWFGDVDMRLDHAYLGIPAPMLHGASNSGSAALGLAVSCEPTPSDSALIKPIRKKRKARGFICEIPDCDKVFDSQGELRKHQRWHLPEHERPLACDQCQRRFIDKRDLQRHEDKVHKSAFARAITGRPKHKTPLLGFGSFDQDSQRLFPLRCDAGKWPSKTARPSLQGWCHTIRSYLSQGRPADSLATAIEDLGLHEIHGMYRSYQDTKGTTPRHRSTHEMFQKCAAFAVRENNIIATSLDLVPFLSSDWEPRSDVKLRSLVVVQQRRKLALEAYKILSAPGAGPVKAVMFDSGVSDPTVVDLDRSRVAWLCWDMLLPELPEFKSQEVSKMCSGTANRVAKALRLPSQSTCQAPTWKILHVQGFDNIDQCSCGRSLFDVCVRGLYQDQAPNATNVLDAEGSIWKATLAADPEAQNLIWHWDTLHQMATQLSCNRRVYLARALLVLDQKNDVVPTIVLRRFDLDATASPKYLEKLGTWSSDEQCPCLRNGGR
jgi:hypothetical protein